MANALRIHPSFNKISSSILYGIHVGSEFAYRKTQQG
jgi:hypothetical protein